MSPHAPTSSRYLVGSLLGAFAGAIVLVLAGGSSLEHKVTPRFFPFVIFITSFMFVAFVVVGWPLFLLLRDTRWFRFSLAASVGAAVGVAATVLFGGPGLDLVSLGFAATGAVSTAVCWWFMALRLNSSGTPT